MTTEEAPAKQKSRALIALLPTVLFLVVFTVNLFIPVKGGLNATQRMWLLSDVLIIITAAVVLIINHLPKPKYIIISSVFAAMMFVAYTGFNFTSVKCFIGVFLAMTASFSIYSRYSEKAIKLLKSTSLKGVIITVALALVTGALLGTINLFLSGQSLEPKFDIIYFIRSLSPAIYEEVCFRFFTFAFILFLLKGRINTKGEAFLVYVFMILPHAIIHTPDVFIAMGPVNGIINTLVLAVLFGLPFALLARKRDLTSAMVSHGLVDFIRFIFMGLPV